MENLKDEEAKIIGYFWNKTQVHTAIPVYIFTFLEYSTVADEKSTALMRLRLLDLVQKGYLSPYRLNFEVFELTNRGRDYLIRQHSTFRQKIDAFNASFPPALLTISTIFGIIGAALTIYEIFKAVK